MKKTVTIKKFDFLHFTSFQFFFIVIFRLILLFSVVIQESEAWSYGYYPYYVSRFNIHSFKWMRNEEMEKLKNFHNTLFIWFQKSWWPWSNSNWLNIVFTKIRWIYRLISVWILFVILSIYSALQSVLFLWNGKLLDEMKMKNSRHSQLPIQQRYVILSHLRNTEIS